MGKREVSTEQKRASEKRKEVDNRLVLKCFEYIKNIGSPVVVEVGGCTGVFMENIKRVNGNTEFYIIEPFKKNIDVLKDKFPDSKIFEGIAYSMKCSIDLFIPEQKSKKHKPIDCSIYRESSSKNNASIKGVVKVNADTLTKIYGWFNVSKVDLLSMNCEGGEYDIFVAEDLGFLELTNAILLHMHTKCRLFLGAEYEDRRRDIVKVLQSRGFHMEDGMTDMKALAHVVQLWKKTD